MKYNTWYRIMITSCLMMLSGCGKRWVDWGYCTFNQGENLNLVEEPCAYLRSIVVYDQLSTSGMFDALWLSDEVKKIYTNAYMAKYNKSEERKMAFLRRQLEENRHFITFYVAVPYRIVLGESQSVWSVFMIINQTSYSPIEVKIVDLDPVYEGLFGKRINQFKVVYRIKFDAKNAESFYLINESTSRIDLVFRTLTKEARLTWDLLPSGQAYLPEVFYENDCCNC